MSVPVLGPMADGVKVTATTQLAAGASVAPHEFEVMANSPLFDATPIPVRGAPPAFTNITLCDALEVLIICRGNFSDSAERAANGFAPPLPVPTMSTVIGAGASSLPIPGGGVNVNAIVPVLVPMPPGVKTTLKVQLEDGGKTNEPILHGPDAGVTLNSALSVTVTLAT